MPVREPTRFRVIHPGVLTTVQDLGRFGFQRFGMPVGGAMDTVALRLANRLVGNPDHLAGLEATVTGPELFFETGGIVAVTGADLSPTIDRMPVPAWTALGIRPGSTLRFGPRRHGARAYLAVAGGIDVPVAFGSRATHLASRTGGHSGRALVAGDSLGCGLPPAGASALIGRTVPPSLRPPYASHPTLRVVLGPQAEAFTPAAVKALTAGQYTVTPSADRMGYRLHGPPLVHRRAAEIISDATPQGSLQVPADQQPILLMADRQTTGGYPKIGVVITVDVPLAAQLLPGDTMTFAVIDAERARRLACAQRAECDATLPPWPEITPP